jgi:hypothetical protein
MAKWGKVYAERSIKPEKGAHRADKIGIGVD